MSYKILQGSVFDQLKTLPDQSVQTIITSPPYWGLRDYGTGSWSGGDIVCDHLESRHLRRDSHGGFHNSESRGTQLSTVAVRKQYGQKCGKCGALRVDNQIGLENTPDEYIGNLVEVFREVRRVLRDDGTLWLNIGDTYAANRGYQVPQTKDAGTKRDNDSFNNMSMSASDIGLKPKDLIGIPWMLAFALRADGWYLRQDIIWNKGNAMPESVTDRCTKSHEHIFLLSKSQRYYFNHKAIQEDAVTTKAGNSTRIKPTERGCPFAGEGAMGSGVPWSGTKRNKRDVWLINTQPYKGAHFAVFPEKLVEPCILAGSFDGSTVLDPFSGSGTVGVVAQHYRRDFIGIELNPEYIELAHVRIAAGSKKLDPYTPAAQETNELRTITTEGGSGDHGGNPAGAGDTGPEVEGAD